VLNVAVRRNEPRKTLRKFSVILADDDNRLVKHDKVLVADRLQRALRRTSEPPRQPDRPSPRTIILQVVCSPRPPIERDEAPPVPVEELAAVKPCRLDSARRSLAIHTDKGIMRIVALACAIPRRPVVQGFLRLMLPQWFKTHCDIRDGWGRRRPPRHGRRGGVAFA